MAEITTSARASRNSLAVTPFFDGRRDAGKLGRGRAKRGDEETEHGQRHPADAELLANECAEALASNRPSRAQASRTTIMADGNNWQHPQQVASIGRTGNGVGRDSPRQRGSARPCACGNL
jgi:hypothetical protein